MRMAFSPVVQNAPPPQQKEVAQVPPKDVMPPPTVQEKREPVPEVKAVVPPAPQPEAPAVKEDSKADLIAARLAKMRADKSTIAETTQPSQNEEVAKPRKLQQKGFMGFIKRLFGKG